MSPERRESINFWADLALRLLLAGAILWALIHFTLFMNDMRRDLQQSQTKHEALLRDHQAQMRLLQGR
jgi:hypothetical protein